MSGLADWLAVICIASFLGLLALALGGCGGPQHDGSDQLYKAVQRLDR